MIITGFIQVRNEIESGHLERFFDWNKPLFDHIVAFDDKSTDGSAEFLRGKVDLLIEANFCSFASELANKNMLMDLAKDKFPETDWYLWLDADEVLFASRNELEDLIKEAESNNFDGISLPLTNLYKSEYFFRTDSSFDALRNVRLWKNTPNLNFSTQVGLHQLSHPTSIKKISIQENLHVTHFGFASQVLIAKKFANYKLLGQQGLNLWRLIDEQGMLLSPIKDRMALLGSRSKLYFEQNSNDIITPKQSTMFEYLAMLQGYSNAEKRNNPFVSVICPISSGTDWLEFQYGELLALRKEMGPGEVEIIFVAHNVAPDVSDYLIQNNIPHVVAPGKTNKNERYINTMYSAYNYGASKANGRYLLFVESDMSYAPSFLHKMASVASPKKYIVAKSIESGRISPSNIAIMKNFGKSPSAFRRNNFYKYANRVSRNSQDLGGLYIPAIVLRNDFTKLGGFPEGNIQIDSFESYINGGSYTQAKIEEPQISGYKSFIAKFEKSGGSHITNNSAILYHFQKEKNIDSKYSFSNISSGIAIANDQLIGINGELTLWNYLIEDLLNLGIRTNPISLGVNTKLPYKICRRSLWVKPRSRIIFRNATFLKSLRGPWRQVVLLQDMVLSPNSILKRQKIAVNSAVTRVTNSQVMLDFPKSRNTQRRHLLVLPVNPLWEDTPINPKQTKSFDAVFVGAFSETKGWHEIKEVIASYPDANFLCVSKYISDEPDFEHGITPKNVKILRCLETEDLIKVVDSARIFIVGSLFETQCLAAMEAATRNLAICMKDTGLLSKLPESVKDQIGIFHSDLVSSFGLLLNKMKTNPKTICPRDALESAGLTSSQLRKEWINMLLEELEQSFNIIIPTKFTLKIKSKIPNAIKLKIRAVLK
jgi:hypothetical protein